MIIYPDIEILDGRLANYQHGSSREFIYYDQSPLQAALEFERLGAQWLHVADLDQVYDNDRDNTASILEIIKSVNIPVQVVGGIRTMHAVNWWFERGAARIVLGTVGITDQSLVVEASNRHPGAIVISIDTQDGHVMIDGWQQQTSLDAIEVALDLQRIGVAAIIHTDIDRFIGSQESNLALTAELGRRLSIPVISSGTVEDLDDLARLTYLDSISGVILGRALLNKTIDLSASLELTAQPLVGTETGELHRTTPHHVANQGVRVYLSAPSATQPARWWSNELRKAIMEDNTYLEVSIPHDDLETELAQEQHDPEAEQQAYLDALERADVVIASLDGNENEAWSGFECGYAKAMGKPVIGLKAAIMDGTPGEDRSSLISVCDEVIYYEQYDDVQHTISCLARAVSDRLLETEPLETTVEGDSETDPAALAHLLRERRTVW